MALLDQVQKDMTEAMRARDESRLNALRMIKTALQKRQIDAMKKHRPGLTVIMTYVYDARDVQLDNCVRGHVDAVLDRVALLWPAYQIKWCCILLNEFLPEGQARRRFSDADRLASRQPAIQLQKARSLLARISRLLR